MRPWRRGAALLLAAVFAVATMTALHHAATALHVVCERHGEVVHLHGVLPGRNAPLPGAAYASGKDEHHEHGCATLVFLKNSAGGATPVHVGPGWVPEPTSGPAPRVEAAAARVPLFLLAPKQSPPSV